MAGEDGGIALHQRPRSPRVLRWRRTDPVPLGRMDGVLQMFQVRIHGRGGQGVVTAAELLSVAAFQEGAHAQAFPSFGSERTGAPVISFCRIADQEIRLREPIIEPDALIVQDPTLLQARDLFSGLKPDGFVLLNTNKELAALPLGDLPAKLGADRCRTVPASEIALKHIGRPLPNAALLGAFAALTGVVKLESVLDAIRGAFPAAIAAANVAAATAAHDAVGGGPVQQMGTVKPC